jgi:hypothetical protein
LGVGWSREPEFLSYKYKNVKVVFLAFSYCETNAISLGSRIPIEILSITYAGLEKIGKNNGGH